MKKIILILGGGPEQLVAIRIAKELGYTTLVVDDNSFAPANAEADIFIVSKIKNVEQLIRDISKYKFEGVMTHAAELAVEVAYIAKHFKLPGISVESAEKATLKHKRLQCFQENNVKIAKFIIIKNSDEYSHWKIQAREIGYPLVVKPTEGKGAVGVLLVRNEKELNDYFQNQCPKLLSQCYLFEEYLSGVQYSTESVLFDGKILRTNIAYRHYEGMDRFYPYLIEDGHSMSVEITEKERLNIEQATMDSCKALGIGWGIVKGDLLVNEKGEVYVIEMAARSSGGRFADFVTVKQCGVQILYALIQMSMGEKVEMRYLEEQWNYGVSQRFIFLEEGTTIEQLNFIDVYRSRQGVEDIVFSREFLINRKQNRICSHRDRIGYVICRDSSREKADKMALSLCAEIVANMKKE